MPEERSLKKLPSELARIASSDPFLYQTVNIERQACCSTSSEKKKKWSRSVATENSINSGKDHDTDQNKGESKNSQILHGGKVSK